ncbi:MAG: cell division protein FtsA [bacterium]|nr:cell division protein FtsA [bacterium]
MNHQYIIAGLDIGSHTIKLALARQQEEGQLEIITCLQEPSAGMRKGAVANIDEVVKRIAHIKQKGEQACGHPIEEAVINLGGSRVSVITSHGVVAVSRADSLVSQEDIERVLQAAQAFSLPPNKEIVDVIPQQYIVDGEGGIKDPIGMKGVRLEVDVLVVCAFSPHIKSVQEAVLGGGLDILDMVPSSLMASAAVLTPRQKELGVALIDLGAGTTSLSVFEEGSIIHAAVLPIGSENITHDIAIGLRTEHEIAERVKIEMGSCVASKGKKMEKIEIAEGEILSFTQKFLVHIIEARVKEIFQLVSKELKGISRQGQLPGGVVLVGGGANLLRISDIAKKELKLSVKLGVPHGMVTSIADQACMGALGLVVSGASSQEPSKRKQTGGIGEKIKKLLRVFIP